MAISKRILVCECGEQFEENRDDGTVSGRLVSGKWKFTHHQLQAGHDEGHDIVLIYFLRSVACAQCNEELFREKRHYEVGANKTRKPSYPPSGTTTGARVQPVVVPPEKPEVPKLPSWAG